MRDSSILPHLLRNQSNVLGKETGEILNNNTYNGDIPAGTISAEAIRRDPVRKPTFNINDKGSIIMGKRGGHDHPPVSPSNCHSVMRLPIHGGKIYDFLKKFIIFYNIIKEIITNANPPHLGFAFSEDSPVDKRRYCEISESKQGRDMIF